jgi:nucleoid-associated protein YgaU
MPRGSTARAVLGAVAVVVAGVGPAAALGAWAVHAWSDLSRPGFHSPEDVLIVVCCTAATLLWTWFAGGLAISMVAVAPGRLGAAARSISARAAPALARRLAAALVGSAMVAGPGLAASAAPLPAPQSAALNTVRSGRPAAPPRLPDPGWRPDGEPAGQPVPLPHSRRSAETAPGLSRDAVVVRRGDTLWAISARRLPAQAGSARIDAEWRRWHAANRRAIGANPHLILVGLVLRPPASQESP